MKMMTWPVLFLFSASFRGVAALKKVVSSVRGVHVPQRVLPKTMRQQQYVDALYHMNTSLVLGIGPAGCGKTLLASSYAMEHCLAGYFDKIVLTRPVVPVEEELGYLPGNVRNKMEPWTQPIMDVFQKVTSRREVDAMLEKGTIEIVPLAYMRGRSFQRTLVLADEMQNSSPSQMKMLTTRVGEASKLVIMGDLEQSDLPIKDGNGLEDLYHRFVSSSPEIRTEIALVRFGNDDVVRSALVKQMLQLYDSVPRKVLPAVPQASSPSNDDAALVPRHHASKHFPLGP